MGWLTLQIIFWITGTFWLIAAIVMIRSTLTLKHLPPLQSFANPPPSLSVLIVVRDRSRDATPQILSKLAAEFQQLKTITIDHLPENWLGKCHAMHVGAHY